MATKKARKRKKLRNHIPFVEICWVDSTDMGLGWCDHDHHIAELEPIRIITRGFVVGQSKDAIKVSPTISEDNGFYSLFVIPKGCIINIRRLK